MKQFTATITSKGQTTIPAEVRRHLGVDVHDHLVFVIEDNGSVSVVTPRFPTIASLRGIAGSLREPMTWHEMRDIAREQALGAKLSGDA